MTSHLNCFPLQMIDPGKQEISITNEELCLASIYAEIGIKPLWVTTKGPGIKATTLFSFLINADTEGLEPRDYYIDEIKEIWQSTNPDHLALLDTRLTIGLVKYVHDLTYGRIGPYLRDPVLFAEAGDTHFKPVVIVRKALAAPDPAKYLASLPPTHQHYRNLRKALQFYRKLAQSTDWYSIPDGKNIYPGNRDERMVLVRQRLTIKGFPVISMEDEDLYDAQTEFAIRNFQRDFGLETDGIIGWRTLAALNISPGDIIQKILLNMARWRWQEHDLGQRFVMVNIASYDLRFFENDHEVISMPVIVGQLQHQTPVFSDRIEYIDFNPFWNIPPSIARNEELPALRKDPYYLVNRNVRLFSNWQEDAIELDSTQIDWNVVTPAEMSRYKLRQDPGPWNALGQVKFVFPNHNGVYIHGTPHLDLFEKSARSFSHGCIRASQPLILASLILAKEKEEWSLERIQEIVTWGKRKVVRLSQPLPVHITYQTVWVDNGGKIHFNNDNYGRDKMLADILFK